MNALSISYYSRYAQARITEAQRTIDQHVVCAYTGLCLGCGRPGPCDERDQAERTLEHHARRPNKLAGTALARPPDNRGHRWPNRSTPDPLGAGTMTGNLANTAIRTADGTVEPLRAACLALTEALERAEQQLDGVDHHLAQTTLATWNDALDHGWESLTMVYAGLADARHLHGAEPAHVGDVLAGLRAARRDAGRAAREVERVRHQLSTAEDRLRRAHADPRAHATARHWAAAGARLDLVAARLAIGTRALDRYAANLAGTPEPGTPEPGATSSATRLTRLLNRPRPSMSESVEGARTAARLVIRLRPYGGWRGFMARLRQNAREEFTRPWTA
ncbi:hypothetical protein ACI2K4_17595 [Micromonospora sp. NPDC050397]|uniref:hypothetical protein n=1 Tax=Micromonospora sp. NPDC050397 TaxID=3364279 RepID=UPI00384C9379